MLPSRHLRVWVTNGEHQKYAGRFPRNRSERGVRTAFVGFVHVDDLRPNRRRESAPQGICEEAAHGVKKRTTERMSAGWAYWMHPLRRRRA